MKLTFNKGYKNKLHYYFFFRSKFVTISLSCFLCNAFGIYIKNNGRCLDIFVDIFFITLNISFWDGKPW